MRVTPLKLGTIYLALGVLFTVFATMYVSKSGWGFIAYFLVLLATLDFGSGIRMMFLHWKIKSMQKKKK